jgi:rare lipoprotein A
VVPRDLCDERMHEPVAAAKSAPFCAPSSRLAFHPLLLLLLVSACVPATPHADPHYVLGQPYQANGAWYYPAESYELDETGLAAVLPDAHASLTTDGEAFDQTALAAAHPTLQLPAIARLTNLETGRSVVLRINDRGTGDPRRLLQVTRRVALLLGMTMGEATQVRLQVLVGESHAAADALPGAPRLAMSSAPLQPVQAVELAPLAGTRQSGGNVMPRRAGAGQEAPLPAAASLRLPEVVTQGPPEPGRLWVRLDTFEDYRYAAMQRTKVSRLSPDIVSFRAGRVEEFRVQVGPISSVATADAVLGQALAAGIPDARIVVE